MLLSVKSCENDSVGIARAFSLTRRLSSALLQARARDGGTRRPRRELAIVSEPVCTEEETMEAHDATRLYRTYSASGFVLRPVRQGQPMPRLLEQRLVGSTHVPVVQQAKRRPGRPRGSRNRSLLW